MQITNKFEKKNITIYVNGKKRIVTMVSCYR